MLLQSVLELEAEVQRDPTNATAWFNLGVKQQENERESKAVLALSQAIALDSTHLPAWLALAISHTNEAERDLAEEAINQWIRNNTKYEHIVTEHFARFESLNGVESGAVTKQMKRDGMVQCLMTMARSLAASGEMDADVQIALAVLLNTGEDYTKAQDCFKSALSARPEVRKSFVDQWDKIDCQLHTGLATVQPSRRDSSEQWIIGRGSSILLPRS